MLTKLFRNKKRPPRLHRILKKEDAEKHAKRIPDIATDGGVQQLDHFERNAIHIACGNPHITLETMDILLEMYPDGLMEEDRGGRLPFHTAIAYQTDRRILQYLIDHYPDCMQEKTRFGVSLCATRACLIASAFVFY